MQTVSRIEPRTPAAHERQAFFSSSGPMAMDAPLLHPPRHGLLALEDGIVQEGVLRKSFLRNGEYLDQTLWTILDEDWRRAKSVWGGQVH